jgi:hypothetical protein
MNSAERLFTFKVSLIMEARMLGFAMGIFSTSQFLGTFFWWRHWWSYL